MPCGRERELLRETLRINRASNPVKKRLLDVIRKGLDGGIELDFGAARRKYNSLTTLLPSTGSNEPGD